MVLIAAAIERPSRKAKSANVCGQRRSKKKMFRAGLCVRVSTGDQQTVPMQNRSSVAASGHRFFCPASATDFSPNVCN